jgi:uncharacterized protein YkwD
MKNLLLAILIASISVPAFSQKLTSEESKLYELIMNYRLNNGLPKIPLSPDLTIVAHTHVLDLETNHPDSGDCNMHSWSSKGNWSAVCYTADHAQARGMWVKPKELTNYKGNGYEIAHSSTALVDADRAINGWKYSPRHNAVILNKGIWKDMNWKAIGIGIYGHFAVVWFGTETND